MEALGFRFEPFGDAAVRVLAVPGTVTDPEAALLAALHALAGGEDLAKALACKGSRRFGEDLSREEMEMLLREWSSTEFRERSIPEVDRTTGLAFHALLTEGGSERLELARA